jgi:hypothetical protein
MMTRPQLPETKNLGEMRYLTMEITLDRLVLIIEMALKAITRCAADTPVFRAQIGLTLKGLPPIY